MPSIVTDIAYILSYLSVPFEIRWPSRVRLNKQYLIGLKGSIIMEDGLLLSLHWAFTHRY